MKDVLWLQTMDTWAMEVFDFFFFLLIGLIGIEALLPTAWCFQWGFSLQYMGGGWANGKRTQWLGFLILRKIERTVEFVEGKRELEWKRLCVCSSGGRSMARGLAEARLPLSFSVSFTVSSLFIASLSSCFFLRVFIASLSILSPLYFYLCVIFNFNRFFIIIIYNKRILNGVVTLPNNTMYRFFKLYVSEF